MLIIITIVIAYLLGNISPARLIGKMYGVDITKEGSGNPGTTNVLRVLGKKAAAATLTIDIGKGVAAVLIGRLVGTHFVGSEVLAMQCCLAVFLGHLFPFRYNFKGGKGVATGFGALAALNPALGFSELGVAALGMIISRRVSVGSIAAGIAGFILPHFLMPEATVWVAIMGLLILYAHRSNIKRLLKGEEPPLSFGSKKKEDKDTEERM